MRAAIYVRVSTEDQAENGYSLDTQIDACHVKALSVGATHTIDFIEDGYSGQFLERPALTKLRDSIQENNFDMVVFYDPDRMARRLEHQLAITREIDKAGVQLHFVSEEFKKTPEGILYFSMRGAIAEYEKEKIRERSMRGKKGKLKKGKIIGNSGVYGFDWDAEKQNYKINEEQAVVIRHAYKLLIEEKIGCLRIANRFNELGIPRPKGARWHYAAVNRLFKDEKYAGIHNGLMYYHSMEGIKKRKSTRRDKSEWIPVPVPAIVDRETWDKAQAQLAENKQNSSRNTQQIYLLKDIIVCDKCGKLMSPWWGGGGQAKYYACRSKRGLTKNKCGARLVRCDATEEKVWNTVKDLCENKDKLEQFLLKNSTPNNEALQLIKIEKLVEQEKKLLKLRDKYMSWFDRDIINEDDADKKLTEIKLQLNNIAEARKKIIPSKSNKKTAAEIISEYRNSDLSSSKSKASLLKKILKAVYVMRIDTNYGNPEITIRLEFY